MCRSASNGLWLVDFLRGEIPLKCSIKNSLQGTRTSCERGWGKRKDVGRRQQ